jgi:hypothetical protein
MKKPTASSGDAIKKSGRLEAEPDFFDTVTAQPNSTATATFSGTNNPREQRALAALLNGPVPRERLDSIAGCSNGPALVASLRSKGLGMAGLCCTMVPGRDRDGKRVLFGVYALSGSGRRAVVATLRRQNNARSEGVKLAAPSAQLSLLAAGEEGE